MLIWLVWRTISYMVKDSNPAKSESTVGLRFWLYYFKLHKLISCQSKYGAAREIAGQSHHMLRPRKLRLTIHTLLLLLNYKCYYCYGSVSWVKCTIMNLPKSRYFQLHLLSPYQVWTHALTQSPHIHAKFTNTHTKHTHTETHIQKHTHRNTHRNTHVHAHTHTNIHTRHTHIHHLYQLQYYLM